MQKTYKLTAERKKALQEELNYLKTVKGKEVAEQIKEARSFGDLSENSEYDEAKNEQGRMFSRMVELEEILSHAQVITPNDASGVVAAGCRVTVIDLDTEAREEYTVVGSQEANPLESRISDESPFGCALLGKHEGDEVQVNVPAGALRYKIIGIHVGIHV
ncbi:MAG: transcription elongation factor GreA [Oscillospiraceae bacterium]|nr:transcription elongation factor GreA [Oscillospiraceae bacterium]